MPKSYVSFLIPFFLILLAPMANAGLITVEPDDYAPGSDLTNASPYVTLQSVYSGTPGSITADSNGALGDPLYVAPTGNLTFGNHGFFVFGDGADMGGFRMTFHQAVSNVSLLANNEYPPGLLALWAAFDSEGNIIGQGSAGHNVPLLATFEIKIELDNIWGVIVGGAVSTAAINFDHLTFEIDDVASIPEPAPFFLMLSGLLCILLKRFYYRIR